MSSNEALPQNVDDLQERNDSQTFSLYRLDKYAVHLILEKTDSKTFIKFFQSCKPLKSMIENKSNWQIPIPDATLMYLTDSKFFIVMKEHNKQRVPSPLYAQPNSYFTFPRIVLKSCKKDYLREQVLPEIRKMKGIKHVELNYQMDEEDLRALFSVLQQPEFKYQQIHYREDNAIIKLMENIIVDMNSTLADELFNNPQRLITLVKDRVTVHLELPRLLSRFVEDILMCWLKGKDLGRLEKLVYSFRSPEKFEDAKVMVMRKIAIETSYQDLICGLSYPGANEASLGATISNQCMISRNPRYGSKKLLLEFREEIVVFQFFE